MKRLSLVLLVVVFFAACKKNESERPAPIDPVIPTIFGQWKQVQSYMSIGSAGSWTDVQDGGKIMFKPDSTYVTNKPVSFFGTQGTISSKNDSTIIIPNTRGFGQLLYKYSDNNSTITLWFIGCIEGCGVKLKRVAFPG